MNTHQKHHSVNAVNWDKDPAEGSLPVQLIDLMENVFARAQITVTAAPYREAESAEYGASRFEVNGNKVLFRVSKTTPTKVGQFVTLWHRPEGREIAPFHQDSPVDFVLVCVFENHHKGFFLFDRATLLKKRIFSHSSMPQSSMSQSRIEGKRAIRVYAPWVAPMSKQAISTQKWQSAYFFSLHDVTEETLARLKARLS